MSKKPIMSRVTEIILSLGIPTIGYLNINPAELDFSSLLWQVPVTLLAAWHVIIINDSSFGKGRSLSKVFMAEKNIAGALLILLILLPALYVSPLFGALIFLTMLNWDIYSLKGKRNWISGLFHNFTGGALHFMIGLSAAAKFVERETLIRYWPEILFFAFTMTAGAMHHDSFDADEDRAANYATGAVKFSSDLWWRLGAVPFSCGVLMLWFCKSDFTMSFMLPSIIYLTAYSVISFRSSPSSVTAFRTLCRCAFVAGAAVYAVMRLI